MVSMDFDDTILHGVVTRTSHGRGSRINSGSGTIRGWMKRRVGYQSNAKWNDEKRDCFTKKATP